MPVPYLQCCIFIGLQLALCPAQETTVPAKGTSGQKHLLVLTVCDECVKRGHRSQHPACSFHSRSNFPLVVLSSCGFRQHFYLQPKGLYKITSYVMPAKWSVLLAIYLLLAQHDLWTGQLAGAMPNC